MLSAIVRSSVKKNFQFQSSLIVVKRSYQQQSKNRFQQEMIDQQTSVSTEMCNNITTDSRALSLFSRLIKLSDMDPQLKNIIGQYRNDLERYSVKMEKETAHRIFECNLRVQQYLRNAGDHKQDYDNRFLTVLDGELADECASLNKQLEKQLFAL